MSKKPKIKEKTIKAWTIERSFKENLFMSGEKEEYLWARILRTKKQAKEEYPNEKVVPVEIIKTSTIK